MIRNNVTCNQFKALAWLIEDADDVLLYVNLVEMPRYLYTTCEPNHLLLSQILINRHEWLEKNTALRDPFREAFLMKTKKKTASSANSIFTSVHPKQLLTEFWMPRPIMELKISCKVSHHLLRKQVGLNGGCVSSNGTQRMSKFLGVYGSWTFASR